MAQQKAKITLTVLTPWVAPAHAKPYLKYLLSLLEPYVDQLQTDSETLSHVDRVWEVELTEHGPEFFVPGHVISKALRSLEPGINIRGSIRFPLSQSLIETKSVNVDGPKKTSTTYFFLPPGITLRGEVEVEGAKLPIKSTVSLGWRKMKGYGKVAVTLT